MQDKPILMQPVMKGCKYTLLHFRGSQAKKVGNHCLRIKRERCIVWYCIVYFYTVMHVPSSILISSSSAQLMLQT